MTERAEELLRELYSRFSQGDMPGVLAMCDPAMKWHVPGTTPFSGDHDNAGFLDFVGQVMAISGGTFREDVVDIIANDAHGVVILDHYLTRDGKEIAYRTDHVWKLRDGKFIEWAERPGDEAAFSRAWS